ncbi:MAG: endonuclease III [Anaerolineae bacterium]
MRGGDCGADLLPQRRVGGAYPRDQLVLGTPDFVPAPRGDRQLVEKGGMVSSEDKALAVHALLLEEYGHHEWRSHHDAVSELVRTILSQNTSDVNSDRAFARLQSRFATWEQLLLAGAEEIVEAIQPGGLAWIKAPRIQKALQAILKERGELSLDFLKDMDIQEASAWLVSLEGVGPKTAACVLLFALGRPALPVDTHVLRVSRRLGLIGPRDSAEKAHIVLGDLLPDEAVYDFHVNMVTHGRQVCRAQRPRCDACCLAPLCDYLHKSR